ncbi:hypothetical protein SAMN05192546_107156 [Tindallia californiensis]|uniref:TIGR00299 family protein n=1 Tax=Tindallia californiensis TaxID=159292 RepID=A0A1H3PXD7_9FIRM|nr:hypothetical protein SAMN05192546_107156 [Tindallia californiensis]
MLILEANIDDTTGEMMGYTMEKLLQAGALDVSFTPIYMKKNRPAIKLEVMGEEENHDRLQELILTETSTIGLRIRKARRLVMKRKSIPVETEFGTISVKEARWKQIVKYAPEYEDCRKAAQEHGVSLAEVYRKAEEACHQKEEGKK